MSSATVSSAWEAELIDLSRLPAPLAIEALDANALKAAFLLRFVLFWDEQRLVDPSLPRFEVTNLEANPASIFAKAWSYLRLLDRARVNDAVRAVLAPLAAGADLDNVVARQGLARLVTIAANPALGQAEVREADAQLLRRYLLSFERASAGSAARYQYEALTAFPLAGDVAVIGRAIHGRRGDTDVVVSGPAGRDATGAEMAAVRARILAPNVQPEAVAVSVIRATRRTYAVRLVVEVPLGPDPTLVAAEAAARVKAAADARTLIGGEIPADLLTGAAYGAGVTRVRDLSPVRVDADPYTVPVATAIEVTAEVRP